LFLIIFRWIFPKQKENVDEKELDLFTHVLKLNFSLFLEALLGIINDDHEKFLQIFKTINTEIRNVAEPENKALYLQGKLQVGLQPKIQILLQLQKINRLMYLALF
jgi:hypothetical protein